MDFKCLEQKSFRRHVFRDYGQHTRASNKHSLSKSQHPNVIRMPDLGVCVCKSCKARCTQCAHPPHAHVLAARRLGDVPRVPTTTLSCALRWESIRRMVIDSLDHVGAGRQGDAEQWHRSLAASQTAKGAKELAAIAGSRFRSSDGCARFSAEVLMIPLGDIRGVRGMLYFSGCAVYT